MLPCKVGVRVPAPCQLDREKAFKALIELSKQECGVELALLFNRKLLHDKLVFFRVNHPVPIVVPSVLKVSLKLGLEQLIKRPTVVKLDKQTEELRKLVTLAELNSKLLCHVEDLDEATHNIREHTDSQQEQESNQDSLCVTAGVKVAETNGRHSREGPVVDLDHCSHG